jgi:DNA-binding SARP family transcriptional activator
MSQVALDLAAPRDRTRFDGTPAGASHAFALDAFDRFPNGIMVCDRHGRVVAANTRLWELVTGAREPECRLRSCCQLLGCRAPDGPLGSACLTTLALETGGRVPEVRIDLGAPHAATIWVTAAPLYEDGSHVVVEVRPEHVSQNVIPRLRIFALGPLRIETPDGRLAGGWLEQRPGQLLRFLVSRRSQPAPTDVIAEALWREPGPAAPGTIRYLVHALRDQLEPERGKNGESATIVCRRGCYALHPDHVWVDVDEYERELKLGTAALYADDRSRGCQHLERAVRLYGGDFLADEPFADWAMIERERLRGLACDALRTLSRLRGGATANHLERLAELEPFDDDVQRELISEWLRLGRKSRAARHYQSFRLRSLREFGRPPDFELAHLIPAAHEAGR